MTTPGERYVCRPDAPWKPGMGPAIHPAARDVGECSDGCCDKYECPLCGHRFIVVVPE